ncbi:GPI-anchored surface protein, putative [Bodo saltans]|uniref:GPI-anchored surface protein, putative n=1 Tax=Bodo saltans TaxID=75058 RepID=A0A0S4JS83_BODSA|nr:GPI-anchored surface protein, putative [Bodo saltans]|eukprot:CUG92838.1 GPI-anchored surface protein, putative [Bodo saltans]
MCFLFSLEQKMWRCFPLSLLLLVCSLVAWICNATVLDCTSILDATNPAAPNLTITTAGDYDIMCVGPSTWFLFIAGCENGGSTAGTVILRLLSSPTQIVVSDNGTLLPMVLYGSSGPLSLRGCRVNTTYFASTVVPVFGSKTANDAHILVHTASPIAAVVVSVLATMYLEGMFVAVVGNGTGSIDLVDISFPPGCL